MIQPSPVHKNNNNYLIIFQYVAAALLLAAPHLLCDNRRPQTLRWLLAPSAALVSRIGHLPFRWEPYAGYVNHGLKFIIAPSCSGLTFFTIAAAMLIFSFLHRPSLPPQKGFSVGPQEGSFVHWPTYKKRSLWIPASLLLAYVSTILANSLRILLAIYVPFLIQRYGFMPAGLTQDTLHTMIGAGVYFPSLLLLYPAGERLSSLLAADSPLPGRTMPPVRKRLLPAFWYLAVVLGIPFVLRLVRNDLRGFRTYASAVLAVCIAILLAAGILRSIRTALPAGILKLRETVFYKGLMGR